MKLRTKLSLIFGAVVFAIVLTIGMVTYTKSVQMGTTDAKNTMKISADLAAKEIEGKLRRLAETYTDGLIDRDTYKRKLADLTQQLQTAREAPSRHAEPVSDRVREFLQGDVQTVYGRFTRAEKRRFWHMLILAMKADAGYQITDIVYTNV